jgi:hypothetical protein
MCLLFCDIADDGKIIDSLLGDRVIPMRQYQYFFYLQEDVEIVIKNISRYRVINGQLTLTDAPI